MGYGIWECVSMDSYASVLMIGRGGEEGGRVMYCVLCIVCTMYKLRCVSNGSQ